MVVSSVAFQTISYRIGDQGETRVPVILARNPNSHYTRRVSIIPAAEGFTGIEPTSELHLSQALIPLMSQALLAYT